MLAGTAAAIMLISGCDENGAFSLAAPKTAEAAADGTPGSTRLVERDVEAPEVFSATDQGLWDGRPSLGGVWVAYPDVTEPERVIIRNEANGKFVIGALFRKERDLPGPKLQISSDAAAALGILAGAPAPLNVTALRREEAPEEVVDPTVGLEGVDEAIGIEGVEAPAAVTETALDPIAAAGAAIENAPATPVAAAPVVAAAAPAPAPTPVAAPAPKTSSLDKPFIQIGIFSVEENADRAANQMRNAGVIPTVRQSEINGKSFWRVLVGPATSRSELNGLQKKIEAEGYSDAYAVSN